MIIFDTLLPTPYSLLPTPYSLFPVPYSLFPLLKNDPKRTTAVGGFNYQS
ncbi:hypothetical protein [Moorena sp. SIO3H5]|nr:hypothetical protein [Moorena sp. SIO3H5]NEO73937.1 hypothetical protein [Moorena sp. SIO3H5]